MASVLLASDWVIGTVFVTAALLKFADRRQFISEVVDYHVVPRFLAVPTATLLPAVEILAGALVFVRLTRTVATVVLALCLVAFTAAVVVNLLRGRTDLSCACSAGAAGASTGLSRRATGSCSRRWRRA